ncbi:MAG: DUF2252 family protein, partial [Marinobacter sp.]|nr:DUF2252 family protein [Marinobacter sp.]
TYREDDLEKEIHYTADTAGKPLKKFLKKVGKKKGRERMLEKWTRLQKNGKRVFDTTNPKLKRLSPVGRKQFLAAFDAYRQERQQSGDEAFYRIKDVARRISAGTGSLGTLRFYALIEGGDVSQTDDIILDIKQQDGPALLLAMSEAEQKAYRRVYPNEGIRHQAAFRALAEHPDRYLGWLKLDGTVFSIRERSPFKDDFPTDKLDNKKHFLKMAGIWGEVLATEHKRASRSVNPDEPFLFEQTLKQLTKDRESEFVTLVSAIASHYAECVERDFQTFLDTFEPSTH